MNIEPVPVFFNGRQLEGLSMKIKRKPPRFGVRSRRDEYVIDIYDENSIAAQDYIKTRYGPNVIRKKISLDGVYYERIHRNLLKNAKTIRNMIKYKDVNNAIKNITNIATNKYAALDTRGPLLKYYYDNNSNEITHGGKRTRRNRKVKRGTRR